MAAKDSKEKEAALPEGQAEKPKKKSRVKRLVIILTILLMTLAAAGGGAYWWLYMRTPGEEHGESYTPQVTENSGTGSEQANTQGQASNAPSSNAKIERQSPIPRSTGFVMSLPPITVNLSEPGGRRYLKLGLEVEVNSDVGNQLKENNARIRDAIIMLLAGKTYGDVSSPDGKVLLKAEIAARINQILGSQRVVRVYFTDFVVD